MDISLGSRPLSIFSQPFGKRLKSTEEKLERQQKAQSQIDFLEERKTALKEMHCGTLDEIAHKLALFDSYEDQIAAVRQQYSKEQMMHSLDEAKERGEKIAEAAKKREPKTAEERREELIKEALGIEDDGMLSELLEDLPDMETLEEMAVETLLEQGLTEEELAEETEITDVIEMEAATDSSLTEGTSAEKMAMDDTLSIKEDEQPQVLPDIVRQEQFRQEYLAERYVPFDAKA